jgi:hypothetical protein
MCVALVLNFIFGTDIAKHVLVKVLSKSISSTLKTFCDLVFVSYILLLKKLAFRVRMKILKDGCSYNEK